MLGKGREPGTTRLILYAGKGGVGKTTVAAAAAVLAAEMGHSTLIVSTDIAHSLGDVLDVQLGPVPQRLTGRLQAQEVNPLEEMKLGWGKVQDQLADVLRRDGMSDVQAEELALLPGMEDVAALMQIERTTLSGDFDCVIVDSAPTGETVRLLSMPESLQWYANHLSGWRAKLTNLAGPFLRAALPDLPVMDTVAQVAARIRHLRSVLIDPQRSSYRIVLTPDRMVLREALRAETYLNVFEYPIDAVVLNRILPEDWGGNPYIDALLARQSRMVEEIRGDFAALPLFEVPMSPEEPLGLERLLDLARRTYGDRDPTAVMHVGATQKVERRKGTFVLQIPMPNVELDRLSLMKQGDSIYVNVGTFRREIPLPLALAGLEPGDARIRRGMLEIPFASPGDDASE